MKNMMNELVTTSPKSFKAHLPQETTRTEQSDMLSLDDDLFFFPQLPLENLSLSISYPDTISNEEEEFWLSSPQLRSYLKWLEISLSTMKDDD